MLSMEIETFNTKGEIVLQIDRLNKTRMHLSIRVTHIVINEAWEA